MLLFKFISKRNEEREKEIEKGIEEEIEDVRRLNKNSQKIRKVTSTNEYMRRIKYNKEIIDSHLAIILRPTKCSAHLYIFELEAKIAVYVMPGKNKKVFDDFYKKNIKKENVSAEGDIDIMKILDIMPISNIDMLKKDLGGYIKDNNESEIKNYGEYLWDELIPMDNIKMTLKAELERDNDEIKDIWIFSEKKDIHYPWELIYWKEKNLFWGDKFSIVRIQEGCDMSECLVNKKIFILANKEVDEDEFVNPLQANLRDAGLNTSNFEVIRSPAKNINLDCCIILYAVGNDNIIRRDYEAKLKAVFIQKSKILFFNLYPPGPLKLDKLPVAWIDSPFDNITEDFTLTFVNCFFKTYKNLLEKRTNVRVTEIVAKTREMMERKNILWRLGCVVNGNPNIMLTA
jgi:hypothetical protein